MHVAVVCGAGKGEKRVGMRENCRFLVLGFMGESFGVVVGFTQRRIIRETNQSEMSWESMTEMGQKSFGCAGLAFLFSVFTSTPQKSTWVHVAT